MDLIKSNNVFSFVIVACEHNIMIMKVKCVGNVHCSANRITNTSRVPVEGKIISVCDVFEIYWIIT